GLWIACRRCTLLTFGGLHASVSDNRRHCSNPGGGPIAPRVPVLGLWGRTRRWQFPFLAVKASAIAFNGQQIRLSAFRIRLVRDDSPVACGSSLRVAVLITALATCEDSGGSQT